MDASRGQAKPVGMDSVDIKGAKEDALVAAEQKIARLEMVLATRAAQLNQVEQELAAAHTLLDAQREAAETAAKRRSWAEDLARERLLLLETEGNIRRRLATELAQAQRELARAKQAARPIESSMMRRISLGLGRTVGVVRRITHTTRS